MFLAFDREGVVSGSSRTALLVFGCRHGSAGLRSEPSKPIVPLSYRHQCAALLRLVITAYGAPSHPSLRSACPMLTFTGLAEKGLGLSGRTGRKTGKDWTAPNS